MPDSRDLNITFANGEWIFSNHAVVPPNDAVVFMNLSPVNCQIVFINPATFGTAMMGLAAGGTLSVNLMALESTNYGVQDWGASGPLTGQHTIEVNARLHLPVQRAAATS